MRACACTRVRVCVRARVRACACVCILQQQAMQGEDAADFELRLTRRERLAAIVRRPGSSLPATQEQQFIADAVAHVRKTLEGSLLESDQVSLHLQREPALRVEHAGVHGCRRSGRRLFVSMWCVAAGSKGGGVVAPLRCIGGLVRPVEQVREHVDALTRIAWARERGMVRTCTIDRPAADTKLRAHVRACVRRTHIARLVARGNEIRVRAATNNAREQTLFCSCVCVC